MDIRNMDRRKLCLGISGGVFVIALALIAIAAVVGQEGGTAPMQIGTDSVMGVVAEGERQDPDRNKLDAYNNPFSGKRNPEDLAVQQDNGMPTTAQAASDTSGMQMRGSRRATSPEEIRALLVGGAEQQPAPVQTQVATASPRKGGGGQKVSRPSTQQERDDKVRHDYELATEIAMRMYGIEPESQGQKASGTPDLPSDRIEVSTPQRSSSAISSLDDSWGDGGLSSLGDSGSLADTGEDHPFKCMFVREEKLKNGQRVTLRLLEDMVVGGVLIPANAHITATCSLKDRLMISVTSYESNGHIYALDMEGYDNDGSRGIYCPDINTSTAKTASNDAMSLGASAIGGRVGALASGIVRTGVSIAKNASGNMQYVSVPSGYTFYIMKTKRR